MSPEELKLVKDFKKSAAASLSSKFDEWLVEFPEFQRPYAWLYIVGSDVNVGCLSEDTILRENPDGSNVPEHERLLQKLKDRIP